MTNIRSIATALFMMLIAFSLAPATASAQSNGKHERPWKVFHLFERATGDLAFVDLGATGPSIGDRLVFSAAIFDTKGRQVGRDGAECVIVRLEPDETPDRQQVVQCTISLVLADGQITVQGLAQGTDNYFAITGGTGAYRQVRGEVRARDIVPLQEAEITIWLYR
jgi:Allene oxide cyclase